MAMTTVETIATTSTDEDLPGHCGSNASSVEYSQTFLTLYQIYYALFMSLIAVVCLIGNTFVIKYSLSCKPGEYSASVYFILSLACSDACQGLVYPFYNIIHLTYSGLATEGCKWIVFMISTPQTISAYNLVGLTIARFFAVYKPHTFYQCTAHPLYRRFIFLSIALIWLIGILSSAILYIFLYEEYEREESMCRYEMKFNFQHAVGGFMVTEVCPGVAMIAFYTAMVCLYRHHRKVEGLHKHSAGSRTKNAKTEAHLAQTAGLLIGIYIITWTPIWIYIFTYTVCLEKQCLLECEAKMDLPFLRATARMLAFSNSAVNVFIYAGKHVKFRKAVKKDIRKLLGCLCICRRCAWACMCTCEVTDGNSAKLPENTRQESNPNTTDTTL